MSKISKILIIIIFLAISCSVKDTRFSIGLEDFYGVWANEHCQMVKTGKYEILFERDNYIIDCSIRKVNSDDKQIYLETVATARYDTYNAQMFIVAKDLMNGGEIIYDNDRSNTIILSEHSCELKEYPEKIIITSKGETVGELAKLHKQLRLQFPSGNWQTLELIEPLNLSIPYMPIKADSQHIGTALHQWRLGTTFRQNDEGVVNSIAIYTNEHSFEFTINTNDNEIYADCRAGRVKTNDRGTLYDETIRLGYDNMDFAARMVSDNFETLRKELDIDNARFNLVSEFGPDNTVYQPVKSFDDTLIVVEGPDGDYPIVRPSKDSPDILEWFEYEDY